MCRGRLSESLLQSFHLSSRRDRVLAMICIMYVRTHGVMDRPIAYKNFSFFSISSQQIFEQLPWSELIDVLHTCQPKSQALCFTVLNIQSVILLLCQNVSWELHKEMGVHVQYSYKRRGKYSNIHFYTLQFQIGRKSFTQSKMCLNSLYTLQFLSDIVSVFYWTATVKSACIICMLAIILSPCHSIKHSLTCVLCWNAMWQSHLETTIPVQ